MCSTVSPKYHLMDKVDYSDLPITFWKELYDGEYVIIHRVFKTVMDVLLFNNGTKGWYAEYIIAYNKEREELYKLYPCYYTRKVYIESLDIFDSDNGLLILEKHSKPGLRRPLPPKNVRKCDFSEEFKKEEQFYPKVIGNNKFEIK